MCYQLKVKKKEIDYIFNIAIANTYKLKFWCPRQD